VFPNILYFKGKNILLSRTTSLLKYARMDMLQNLELGFLLEIERESHFQVSGVNSWPKRSSIGCNGECMKWNA
jgi:hypothetical protein